MPASSPVFPQLSPVFDWLEGEPADDPVEDLAELRRQLRQVDASLPEAVRLRCLEQFEARLDDICERFTPHLLTATLPLPRTQHAAARALVAGLLELAGAFQSVIEALRERWALGTRGDSAHPAGRALRLVNEAYLVSCMSGASAPSGLWERAYALMSAAGLPDPAAEAPPEALTRGAAFHFKRLVALSVLNPESLTGRELAWVFDYVEITAALGRLANEPLHPETSAFWMDPAGDAPPRAAVRRQPTLGGGLLHFSALAMARRAGEQIEWLETRMSEAHAAGEQRAGDLLEPDPSGLPLGLTALEALSLLRRVRDRWSTPPCRETARRPHQYTVQVCAGLRSIWDMCRHGPAGVKLAEWMVCNESSSGYAIMSISGEVGSLVAGMALALRRDASQPWMICIVRWLRSDTPERAEVGLQVIATTCTAVSIGFRGGEAHATSPALVLPPVAGLRSNPAVLTQAGTYCSRRFLIVHEGQHLYITQARVLSLDMQTSSVELFQYEVDTYPL